MTLKTLVDLYNTKHIICIYLNAYLGQCGTDRRFNIDLFNCIHNECLATAVLKRLSYGFIGLWCL